MTLMDEAVWRGKIYSGGWASGGGGDTAVIEPATAQPVANLEAFTDTRWVTIRGDIAPYPV